MRNIAAVFRKELGSYFNQLSFYLVIVLFLAVSSAFFFYFQGFFVQQQASLRGFFALMPWMLLFFLPPVSMRLWAEERKLGTIEVLLTLPLKDWEVVLGKYLASIAVWAVMLALTLTVPLTVAWLGDPDPGPIVGGYLGAFLLGSAYLAIGGFVSSLTSEQLVALVLSFVLLLGLLLIGLPAVLGFVPGSVAPTLQYLALNSHFMSLGRGVIDSRDIVYYLSLIGLSLFLTVRSVESRKWR